jgi:hypothetical protein
MPKEYLEYPPHISSANISMLEIAWEMTKLCISIRSDDNVSPQSLRDEFTKNADAVYKAWGDLGNDKGGRA